ncbi:MAG: nucleotidyltransferase family protein [Aquificota bacterium]|nr:nucleotidyltransferase family protein [Aquificota bacterium]
MENILKILRLHKRNLYGKYGIKTMKIFGSYAEGRHGPGSDLDILVEFEEPPAFTEFIRLEEELSRLLGVKVRSSYQGPDKSSYKALSQGT